MTGLSAADLERSVFLNVPFDDDYGPLFVTLIAALTGLGRIPRCALETHSAGGERLHEIYRLISCCGASVHDLSRVTRSGAFKVPRFNMPFELGIAYGFYRASGHRIFVFEERERRLQASLSDMNGFDPHIHGGTSEGVLYRVLDCFDRPGGTPVITELRSLADALSAAVRVLQSEQKLTNPFKPYIFKYTVAAAVELAQKAGLVQAR